MSSKKPEPQHVMFVPELAEKMGLTQKALRRRVDDNRDTMPPFHRGWVRGIGYRLYWYRSEVTQWLRQHPQ